MVASSLQTSSLLIRPATEADILPLSQLLVTCFHPLQPWLLWSQPFLKLGITEDLRLRLGCHNQAYRCLIALHGDEQEIIGTAEITLKNHCRSGHRHAYIANLAVSPIHRRLGIATQLLHRCEQMAIAWNCQRLSLHVLEDNSTAQALYMRCGFTCDRVEWQLPLWLWRKPRRLRWEKILPFNKLTSPI